MSGVEMDKNLVSFQQALDAAGLDISGQDFLRLFHDALGQQRADLREAASREMSEEEAAAYRAGGFDLEPRAPKGDGPVERTLAEFMALIAESLTVSQAAELLGVDRSRVSQRLKVKSLYGFRREDRTLLPLFQFDHGASLPGLNVVLRVLDPHAHPLSVHRFFTLAQPDLVMETEEEAEAISPRDWLRLGKDPGAVARLARDLVMI